MALAVDPRALCFQVQHHHGLLWQRNAAGPPLNTMDHAMGAQALPPLLYGALPGDRRHPDSWRGNGRVSSLVHS